MRFLNTYAPQTLLDGARITFRAGAVKHQTPVVYSIQLLQPRLPRNGGDGGEKRLFSLLWAAKPPTIERIIHAYFPQSIDRAQLWVNYNPKADSLLIYFTGKPIPSVWDDVDEYANIGFSIENESVVTGLMIEHFSRWLLMPDHAQHQLQSA